MLGWISIALVLVSIFFISTKIAWKRGRSFGQSDERRRAAESEIEGMERAMEDLSAPPPDRDDLIYRWMRRLQKSKNKFPTMSNSE